MTLTKSLADADAHVANATSSLVADLTHPKVTRTELDAAITATEFIARPPLTICIATMRNGFTLVGKSASASPENYDQAVGERYALEDCIRQAWPLMGYALRERLAQEEKDARGDTPQSS